MPVNTRHSFPIKLKQGTAMAGQIDAVYATATATALPGHPFIQADLVESLNYASWQNSVPVIRALRIINPTPHDLSQCELTLEAPFARSKKWVIDRITAGGEFVLRDRDIGLDGDYLNGLNEAERGTLHLCLYQRQELVTELTHEIRVLARDEWGGCASMGELLAAFVMPNDPAIAKIMKAAGEVLARYGHSPSLDGYQSRDPKRAYMLVAALWSVISAERLTYANPPKSFERIGQKTRRPTTILSEGLATCLDSTLLFAAAIEALGLNPVIILQDGHCFVGVWLIETNFKRLIERDCSEVRKAIAARELITFETTLVTQRDKVEFKTAIQLGINATQERDEAKFVAAVDIARARMAQIRPLASHEYNTLLAKEADVPSEPLPLPAAPKQTELPSEDSEERPQTPAGRIERWQRKLLDISLRNRLLNFKDSQQSVSFICPNVPYLEDRLANGAKLRLLSIHEDNLFNERDVEIHRGRTKEDLIQEFARQALQRDEVMSSLTSRELSARLTGLHRKVKSDLAEGGTNTLFLAVGFLRWKQKPEDTNSYKAPLLLMPVQLHRTSALSAFSLVAHEDEIRFNSTLIQFIKQDFARDLTEFESNLPKDNNGVDVTQIFERVRRKVRDIPGFEVTEESALSTFSFAKYLMWKDLVDRSEQLKENRVVRHLIDNPDKPFTGGGSGCMPQPHHVDFRYDPKDLVHPLHADSSQLAAVLAAAEGQDFVLIGPPGTGKSQTIANMIAQCLATKKTVLFVAEKTAALDVVYRRLKEQGLGDCCVELHSNKAERRKFLSQLNTAWDQRRRTAECDWLQITERLKIRRDELNSYVAAIHTPDTSGWSVYQAMGLSVQQQERCCSELPWPKTKRPDKATYQKLLQFVDEIAKTYDALDPSTNLAAVKKTEWSFAWESELLQIINAVDSAATQLQSTATNFLAELGITKSDFSVPELEQFRTLALTLHDTASEDYSVVFHKQIAELPSALGALNTAIQLYQEAEAATKAKYPQEEIPKIPVGELQQQWREATVKLWPMSAVAKRRVRLLLQSYSVSGIADPSIDLPKLQVMQEQLAKIDRSPLAGATPHWQHLRTDTAILQQHLTKAQQARQVAADIARMAASPNEFGKRIAPLLTKPLSGHQTLDKARAYVEAMKQFYTIVNRYQAHCQSMPFARESNQVLAEAKQTAAQIKANRTELQRWTAWCGLKKKASQYGLEALVADLEAGLVEPKEFRLTFQTAYVRWWLPIVIDQNPVLRTFQRFKHEDAIRDFQELDNQARKLASNRVREAVMHDLPASNDVPRNSELGLLRYQISLTRPSKSIREMITSMPENFMKLAPCVLMSPLSIAQYLPVKQTLFDVVIFDEASQITTWDAVGAIARGKQTIIVGDPKQLPPTNFFGRTESDEQNDELEDHERDLESILDEAQASGLHPLQLNWHYRSRHESLIAFSNRRYYGNRLITFPSPATKDTGVHFRYVPDAYYDRGDGKSKTNKREAEAITAEAVKRLTKWLELPEKLRPTLGVITFNIQQQSLIQDLLDQAVMDNPDLEWYFADERIEPVIVKNLESVQGDQRDVMLFSITFGRDKPHGSIPRNFGALNKSGGERRLNVAITRACEELIVFCSFKPGELSVEGVKYQGVKDLKDFLDYAERGAVALFADTRGSVGEHESPFEEAVAAALDNLGWQVIPQIGVSEFRIDLGVVHPDQPGLFLAGIECDGATYHRSATARDRDKTREAVLVNLGWNILRVWSPDWWYDSNGAVQRIHESLIKLLEESRAKIAAEHPPTELIEPIIETAAENLEPSATPNTPAQKQHFQRVDLSQFQVDPTTFYDNSSNELLKSMLRATLETEGPMKAENLYQRIARAYGWQRTGSKIRERLEALLGDFGYTDESNGRFYWPTKETQEIISYRPPCNDDERRSVDEIPLAELRGLINEHLEIQEDVDPVSTLARLLGIGRITQSTRQRLQEAVDEMANSN